MQDVLARTLWRAGDLGLSVGDDDGMQTALWALGTLTGVRAGRAVCSAYGAEPHRLAGNWALSSASSAFADHHLCRAGAIGSAVPFCSVAAQ